MEIKPPVPASGHVDDEVVEAEIRTMTFHFGITGEACASAMTAAMSCPIYTATAAGSTGTAARS
jgi:hypothetical protein